MRKQQHIPYLLAQLALYLVILATNARGLILSNFSYAAYRVSTAYFETFTRKQMRVEFFLYLLFPFTLFLLDDYHTFALFGFYGSIQFCAQIVSRYAENHWPFYANIALPRVEQNDSMNAKMIKISDAFKKMTMKSNLKDVKLVFIDSENISACVDLISNSLYLDLGLINLLSEDELIAVIAHEISHLKVNKIDIGAKLMNDFLNTTLYRYLVFSLAVGATYGLLLSTHQIKKSTVYAPYNLLENELNFLSNYFICHFAALVLSTYCNTEYGRNDEILADRESVHLTNEKQSIPAMIKIDSFMSAHGMKPKSYFPFFDRLVCVHPPIEERKKIIEAEYTQLISIKNSSS